MGNLLSLFRSNPRRPHDLPEELVLQEILPRLPLKSLMRFKLVSKKWHCFIADEPFLSSAFLRRRPQIAEISNIVLVDRRDLYEPAAQFEALLILGAQANAVRLKRLLRPELGLGLGFSEFDKIGILGTCNGLILLVRARRRERWLILCNPVTGEGRVLPEPIPLVREVDFDGVVPCCVWNLGFDDASREHKVVGIVETWQRSKGFGGSTRLLNVQVFNKSGQSWRKLEPLSGYKLLDSKQTVSLDGDLYFLASTLTRRRVLSFSFRDEEVRDIVDLPEYNSKEENFRYEFNFNLTKWKENSLGLMAFKDQTREIFDFWVMNKDRRNGLFSWTKMFELDFSPINYVDFCGVYRDQFFLRRLRSHGIELVLCDPIHCRTKRGPKLAKIGFALAFSLAYEYVPSLVSVHPRPYIVETETSTERSAT